MASDMNAIIRKGFSKGSGEPLKQEPPKDDKAVKDYSVEELVGALRSNLDKQTELVEEVEVRLASGDAPVGDVEEEEV